MLNGSSHRSKGIIFFGFVSGVSTVIIHAQKNWGQLSYSKATMADKGCGPTNRYCYGLTNHDI